jgi:TolB protein
MKHRLVPALLAVAGAVLATITQATPAQAAAARTGVLLVSGPSSGESTRVLDARTGRALGKIGNGYSATVSRRATVAYTRDIDPCHPDIEGCFGAPDLLISALNGSRERTLVHNREAQGGSARADISPDGSRIVYSWNTLGERGLNLINADGTGNEQIVTFGGSGTFSPDGRSVAFVKDDNVQVIDLATREVRVVTTEGLAKKYAPDWSPDGRRLVYAGESTFYVVPASGGPSVAAEPPAMLHYLATPVFSPDGRHVAFTATESFQDPEQQWVTRLFVSSTDGSQLTRVTDSYEEVTEWLGF